MDALYTTVPGTIGLTLGGVARNVAEACHRLSSNPNTTLLVAPVGTDYFGSLLRETMADIGMRTDGLVTTDGRTPACNMILGQAGELVTGVADMDILVKISPNSVNEQESLLPSHETFW